MVIIRRTGPATHLRTGARSWPRADSTLTRDLRSLEQRGLIRISAASANSKSVVLTPQGEKDVEESLIHWRAAQARVVEALGEERWERMRSDLAAVMAIDSTQ